MDLKKEAKKESKLVSIIPLKDHVIKQNDFYYELKKDEMIEIDKRFLSALLTENVISNKG